MQSARAFINTMPPTRREQLELDELLSDIYRGIETLPDKSKQQVFTNHYNIGSTSSSNNKYSPGESLTSRTYVREYELPASSPIVKQHKQDIAAFRNQQQRTTGDSSVTNNSNSGATKQPQRSTLKRHTNTPDSQSTRQQPQSLASFVTSTTPENKRRVRIVDHPDKLQKNNNNYSSDEDYNENYNDYNDTELHQQRQPLRTANKKPPKVKYVNTNKLIYHDEKNADDEIISDSGGEDNNSQEGGVNNNNNNNNNNHHHHDEDIDGVSRIEYYHTTWLDRQLGRASKRRSSKELNERQVKEKAMIEELKRSLKNGAITLRQSFKGKRNANSNKNKPSETYDDQMLDIGTNYSDNSHKRRVKESSNTVFGSGLATIPRNYHSNNSNKQVSYNNNNSKSIVTNYKHDDRKRNNNYFNQSSSTPKQTVTSDNYLKQQQQPTTSNTHLFDSAYQPASQIQPQLLPTAQSPQQDLSKNQYSSRTLPHNYQTRKGVEHQLLQSHYRGSEKPQGLNTLGSSRNSRAIKPTPIKPAASNFVNNNNNSDKMRNLNYNSNTYNPGFKSPINNQFDHHQQPAGETISSLPSATEVVRSALSRSSSQTSVNQLSRTINLLPNSPPPYASSPMSPTQQLKATSPMSPSPDCRSPYQRQNSDLINNKNNTHHAHQHFTSKTMGSPSRMHQQQQSPQHQPATLHGTRIVNKPDQKLPLQQHQNQQSVYANPHASLMQHRVEQQMRQPSRNNNASIREFNELDSLLRSLSPGSTTHITPGFTSKQSQPTIGYGFTAQPQPQPQSQPKTNLHSDIYAKVQKQPVAQPTKTPSYLQQHYGNNPSNININTTNQGYTIDVSDKPDDSCVQRQNLSEFEPPIELIPSMEDYQNITKLNPVKNQYWYKPNMSRDRAISLLKDKPQGTFIVRDSTSFKGAYGLAVKVAKLPKNVLNNANLRNPNGDPSSELIRHFLIEPTENGVRLKGYANESVYDSLPDLIYQHSLTEIALPCKLVIPRADIEDLNFNHKQKQFYDDFVASREIAKHNPYERTSPNGGYRRYPGDVYVHNEHRIIFE